MVHSRRQTALVTVAVAIMLAGIGLLSFGDQVVELVQIDRPIVHMIGGILITFVLTAISVVLFLRLRMVRRVIEGFVATVKSLPWEADAIDEYMLALASEYTPHFDISVEHTDSPPDPSYHVFSAEVRPGLHLVGRRRGGLLLWRSIETQIITEVAAIGRSSYERAESEARLRTEAETDTLTGLSRYVPWRKALEAASAACTNNEIIGVVFFDLDYFKQVNEIYGHLKADVVLQAFGQRLLSLSRHWRFGRYGGDEFVGFRREVQGSDQFDADCDELASSLAEPVVADGQEIRTTVTIGRTLWVDPSEPIDDVIARAESDERRRKNERFAA
jgi:diguanylate cyclase (GGDEF)-like protein